MAGTEEGKPLREDGRALRARKSRRAIAVALFELINEGHPLPTAEEIAQRAGVSLRLVFHHYQDLEAVYLEVMDLQVEKLRPLIEIDISPDVPFEKRLSLFLDSRCAFLETATPMRRAGIIRAVASGLVEDAMRLARQFEREQASAVFRPELSAFSGSVACLRERALQVSVSWNTWDTCRQSQGLSTAESRSVVEFMIRCALDP